jgi:hypothetical protein
MASALRILKSVAPKLRRPICEAGIFQSGRSKIVGVIGRQEYRSALTFKLTVPMIDDDIAVGFAGWNHRQDVLGVWHHHIQDVALV